jgi:hypothetical protein
MTLEEVKANPITKVTTRAFRTILLCLGRGIKNREEIEKFIQKAYSNPIKELAIPGRAFKTKTPHYIKRQTDRALAWFTERGLF